MCSFLRSYSTCTHIHTHTISLSVSATHTHTHTHNLSLSHTNTHNSLSLTLSLCHPHTQTHKSREGTTAVRNGFKKRQKTENGKQRHKATSSPDEHPDPRSSQSPHPPRAQRGTARRAWCQRRRRTLPPCRCCSGGSPLQRWLPNPSPWPASLPAERTGTHLRPPQTQVICHSRKPSNSKSINMGGRELRVGSNIMILFLYRLLLLIWHMYFLCVCVCTLYIVSCHNYMFNVCET